MSFSLCKLTIKKKKISTKETDIEPFLNKMEILRVNSHRWQSRWIAQVSFNLSQKLAGVGGSFSPFTLFQFLMGRLKNYFKMSEGIR